MQRMTSALSFTLQQLTDAPSASGIVRRGTLQFSKKAKTIQTPACLTYTVRGSVPHLVAENVKLLPVQLLQVTLEQFVEEKEPMSFKYPHGIHKYLNLELDHLVFCDMRDPMKQEAVTFNTDKYLSVSTHGGVRQITPEMWAQAMKAYNPDMCALMADIVTDNDAKLKRIKRSVDRSLRWLDDILPKAKEIGIPVFAPVVGHTSEEERARSAVSTAERDVDGFTVNVIGLGLGNEATLKLAKASLRNLPKNKPRIVYGFGTPEGILDAVASGADLFDGSYAYKVTEQGRAMIFKFGEISADNTARDKPKTVNLWDPSMSHSFEVLDSTCGCYACNASHTKAYIHHLLNAHEMLGPILLMSHNVYQLDNFMASIRKSIDDNRFESDLTRFMEYYNHVEEGDGMRNHQDEIDVESLGTPLKKKRTLLL